MSEQNTMKVLRAVRFELDPEVGGPAVEGAPEIFYSRLDVMEIELPEGGTDVLASATDSQGSVHWGRSLADFDATVALNERKERALGAILSGPDVIVPVGSPAMVPGPDLAKVEPVRKLKN
jgi:hypothetical protein